MHGLRQSMAVAWLVCAAFSGCYMRVKAVEDSGRLGAIEQRLAVLEHAAGIPSPPPVPPDHSDTAGTIRVQSFEQVETDGGKSASAKKVSSKTRVSSPLQSSY